MEKLKIAKFGLSLEGQAACWYSQYKLEHFVTFQQLRDKFIRLFHREVTQREIIGQFYATYQEANETVPLQTTLVVLDFGTSTIDQVIDKVLDMDWAQHSNNMIMGALQ